MHLVIIESTSSNVYYNLALEEYLTTKYCSQDEIILFLWNNEKSIVLGRNQCANMECDIGYALKNGINISRRISGGGAVYHDKGNLNYTFIAPNDIYSKELFSSIVLNCLLSLNLNASLSGRNDVEIDGRKISGMAYYQGNINSFLHGCILVCVDLGELERILTVSSEKIESKGIKSVKARVANLQDFDSKIHHNQIKSGLIKEFKQRLLREKKDSVSFLKSEEIVVPDCLVSRYKSDEWIFGKNIQAVFRLHRKFSWGECNLHLCVIGEIIVDAICYSDSLETKIFLKISESLSGCKFIKHEMRERLENIMPNFNGNVDIINDICRMIVEELNAYE